MSESDMPGGGVKIDLLDTLGQLYASTIESVLSEEAGIPITCLPIGQSENTVDAFMPLLTEWSLMFEMQYETVPSGRLGFFFKPEEAGRLCRLNKEGEAAVASGPDPAELEKLTSLVRRAVDTVNAQLPPLAGLAGAFSKAPNAKEAATAKSVYFKEGASIQATLMLEAESQSFDAQILLLISPALAGVLRGDAVAPETPSAEKREVPLAAGKQAQAGGLAGGATPGSEESIDRSQGSSAVSEVERNLERILDIELPISLNFGSAQMLLKDVVQFSSGSVIQLDRTVDEPIYLMVNHKVIARGEVVIVDGNYGIRITEIESTADRIKSLR